MKKGDKIKLTKLSDDKFDGKHPNFINEGFVISGSLINDLTIGEPLFMDCDENEYHFNWFHTSVVEKIINENTFKTKNSTYRIEKI